MVGRVRIELTESGTNGLQPPPAPYGFTCRYVVGVERFELPAFRSQAGRSAQTELRPDSLVYQMGFEPTSFCLQGRCFPIKLPAQIGAPDRTRTCTVRTLIPLPLPELGYWSILVTRGTTCGGFLMTSGAVNGSRTRGLRLGKPMFCQLNYYCMVHDAGLEPAPFCL